MQLIRLHFSLNHAGMLGSSLPSAILTIDSGKVSVFSVSIHSLYRLQLDALLHFLIWQKELQVKKIKSYLNYRDQLCNYILNSQNKSRIVGMMQ